MFSKIKQLWALRSILAILLGFGLAAAAFLWALGHYPGYVGLGILALVLFVIAIQPRVRREQARTNQLVDTAFQNAYGQLSPVPSLVRSSNYGYPHFEVKFHSKAQKESAAPLNQSFSADIQNIFKQIGSRLRPFRAERAISFTYPGYVEELLANHKVVYLKPSDPV